MVLLVLVVLRLLLLQRGRVHHIDAAGSLRIGHHQKHVIVVIAVAGCCGGRWWCCCCACSVAVVAVDVPNGVRVIVVDDELVQWLIGTALGRVVENGQRWQRGIVGG